MYNTNRPIMIYNAHYVAIYKYVDIITTLLPTGNQHIVISKSIFHYPPANGKISNGYELYIKE